MENIRAHLNAPKLKKEKSTPRVQKREINMDQDKDAKKDSHQLSLT